MFFLVGENYNCVSKRSARHGMLFYIQDSVNRATKLCNIFREQDCHHNNM